MKKSFFTAAGLMLLVLAFSSCQKEPAKNAPAASEPNFTLFAQPSSATKTTNDGLDTKWADGDAINVFHAAAGTTTYVSDGQFSLTDTESGKFDGTVSSLTADASYDWYAFYPYSIYLKTSPKNTSESRCYIGSRSDQSQVQTGNDNMSHICGANYPLFGISKSVKGSDTPSIAMQHLTSVIKIVVTNSTDEELSLSNISFTAGEDIAGQFYIAFNSETPTYTPTQYASETANLTVSGVNVAAGSKGIVYMAIKPFTAKSGSSLKLSVNGYEKTLPLTSDVTFTAGHIKTLGFDFDQKIETVEYTAIDDVTKLSDNSRVCIVAKNGNKYYYLPSSTNLDAKGGKIDGKEIEVTDNKINTKLNDVFWTAKASDSQWSFFDGSNYIYHSKGGASGTDLAKGSTATYQWNVTSYSVANKTFKFAAYSSNTVQNRGLLLNSTQFGGYALSNINSNGYAAIMLFVRTIDIPADKPIISSSDVTDVSARGVENQTLAYSISNGVDGAVLTAVGDGTVVTAKCENNAVTYTIAANTTTSDREGTITLTYAKDGVTLAEKTVKVQQLAPVFKVSRASVELDATKGAQTTITVTSDFDWMADASASAGFAFTPDTYTWQEGGKETVTITASADNASESGTATLGTITFSNLETGEEIIVTVTQKSSYVAPTTDMEVTYGLDAFSGGTQGSGSALTISNSDSNISLSGVGYMAGTHVKIYANQTLTITPQNGKTVTKIVITATTSTYAGTWKASTASVSVSGTSVTWTGTSTDPVTLTNTASKQARITKVVVTYK